MSLQKPKNAGPKELDLLLPESLSRPLWKRLLVDFRDRWFAAKLPPLQISARPVNVGMLIGDIISLPWYRTVFTNIGNVITPEILPPLELESRPADVGELVSDQLSHLWWTSLLRNFADRIAPERLPALELTARPVDAILQSEPMQIMRWSSLATLPKVVQAQRPNLANPPAFTGVVPRLAPAPPVAAIAGLPSVPAKEEVSAHAHKHRLSSALSRSRLREAALIAIAVLEGLYLVASAFGLV